LKDTVNISEKRNASNREEDMNHIENVSNILDKDYFENIQRKGEAL